MPERFLKPNAKKDKSNKEDEKKEKGDDTKEQRRTEEKVGDAIVES